MFKSMGNTDGNLFFEKTAWFTPLQLLDSKENGGISVLKGNKVVSIGKSMFFFITIVRSNAFLYSTSSFSFLSPLSTISYILLTS